jgi:excisionase family DNA binding protein
MPNQQLMTIGEVAELLNVGVRHIRRLVAERRIPFIKWGGLLRFDRDDIDRWLDDSRSPTAR